MLEDKIESALRERVLDLGGECFKWVSPGRNGVNDRLIFLPYGRLYMVETKRPGKDLEPHQVRFKIRMAELGFTVHKIDLLDDAENFPYSLHQ